MAASTSPRIGRIGSCDGEGVCCNSQVFREDASHAMLRISPISPIRLYRTAWRAAVLASARPCHHPISMNDMIPTPSHPMNRRNMLLATVRSNMAMRNTRRCKKNLVM